MFSSYIVFSRTSWNLALEIFWTSIACLKYNIYLFQFLSPVCRELWAYELGEACCNTSFSYKNSCPGGYLGGKDIPLLTTLGELKEKNPTLFQVGDIIANWFLNFFSMRFLYLMVAFGLRMVTKQPCLKHQTSEKWWLSRNPGGSLFRDAPVAGSRETLVVGSFCPWGAKLASGRVLMKWLGGG